MKSFKNSWNLKNQKRKKHFQKSTMVILQASENARERIINVKYVVQSISDFQEKLKTHKKRDVRKSYSPRFPFDPIFAKGRHWTVSRVTGEKARRVILWKKIVWARKYLFERKSRLQKKKNAKNSMDFKAFKIDDANPSSREEC